MSEVVIRAEKLGKRYRIGERESYLALRDVLTRSLHAPLRWFNGRKSKRGGNDLNRFIWALQDVSFEVKTGEVLGIIGRNGAGKTTLLKLLARITKPTEGYAEVTGRMGSLLEVGTGFHPELTGRENIYLSGGILGMKKAEIQGKFDEIVGFAEIEKFLDTPVKHYSSGMYIRLAFAVAAHLEPEILLVDEVLAVGDAAFQKKCLGKMGDVAKTGRTVLFVSHNMAAVRSLCSSAFLLSDGRIALRGDTGQCIDHYLLSASEDMPAEVATVGLIRPSSTPQEAKLRITRVRLETGNGRAILQEGAPITLEIEFESLVILEDVVFGWSVYSSDNVRLFECRSTDSYAPIARLAPGKYRLLCSARSNPLRPGFYMLHVGARCAREGLDWLPEVLLFRVEAVERVQSLWLESAEGAIRVHSEWAPPTEARSLQEASPRG